MRTSGSVAALVALGIVMGSGQRAANADSFNAFNDSLDGDGHVVLDSGGFQSCFSSEQFQCLRG